MLAYLDTITSGLVPCEVLAIATDVNGYSTIDVRVTANRGAYKRGDRVQNCSPSFIVPRHAVVRRKYSTWILPFSWVSQPLANRPLEIYALAAQAST